MRILVTGATGYVGSRLVTELLSEGHEVIAASRKPDGLAAFGWYDDVVPVALDASDRTAAATAFGAVGHVDVVYYLVHGIGETDFRHKDNAAARNVAEAAKDAGVSRIVYLGGFVPEGEKLSEHLASRAEVAEYLKVEDGPELVWLRAAVVVGAGSTSFELVRYLSDRLPVIPLPHWADNKMDPISVRDVVYYLVAAADADRLPAGAYDVAGANKASYRELLFTYLSAARRRRLPLPLRGLGTGLASLVSGRLVPVPTDLTGDLVASLDYPMFASEDRIRSIVPDPPGGLLTVRQAVEASLHAGPALPVNKLADIHHLADSDPEWAGGDWLRIRRVGSSVITARGWNEFERLGAGLVLSVGPAAGAVRTGVDFAVSRANKIASHVGR
ncbi:NAD(P)H-binding protein [Williamsia phyllosphaerae]|uniref:Oxidoreductase n=1 Tax=Williamsia phyllosphaerae TaxID=885042 RepID=A0ABQ1UIH3_9NOCA|nr:NAD(P)H-binding protein [Williamsia phyllosphaerae]GGF18966.1 oxidoreductase [Williamsia phyllosphaerae]